MLRVVVVSDNLDLVALFDFIPIFADCNVADVGAGRHDHGLKNGAISGLSVSSPTVAVHVFGVARDFTVDQEINMCTTIVLMACV
jgi:hypothetical protein